MPQYHRCSEIYHAVRLHVRFSRLSITMSPEDEKREFRFGKALVAGAGTYIFGTFALACISLGHLRRSDHTVFIVWVMPAVSVLVGVIVYAIVGRQPDDADSSSSDDC